MPFIVAAFTGSIAVCCLTTFFLILTYTMLNEVARDVEDPFHYDPNELPLPQMQYKLNERLLAVTQTQRPLGFTDVGSLGESAKPSADVRIPTTAIVAAMRLLRFRCRWR